MRVSKRVGAIATAIAVCALVLGAGCRGRSDNISGDEGRRYVIQHFRGMSETLDTAQPLYRTLDELLPTVEYVFPDGSRHAGSDLVVIGHVVKVEKGIGFRVPGEDHPSGIPTGFDDQRSKWRTVHATVQVERGIGREAPNEVQVALPLYNLDKFEHMAAGWPALGRVVLFLDEGSPLATYDRSLYVLQGVHSMVATIAEDGALALPLVASADAARLLAPVRSLAELEAKAKLPRTIVLPPGTDGAPTRPANI